MNYPQYPQGAMPAPAGGYQQQATSGTTTAAGVLSVLGGIAYLIMALLGGIGAAALGELSSSYGGVSFPGWYTAYSWIAVVVYVIIAGLLITGAIMLFTKKAMGVSITSAGCILVLIMLIVGVIVSSALSSTLTSKLGGGSGYAIAGGFIGFLIFGLPAAITLILTLLPSTRNYLREQAALRSGGAPAMGGAPGGFPPPGPPGFGPPQF